MATFPLLFVILLGDLDLEGLGDKRLLRILPSGGGGQFSPDGGSLAYVRRPLDPRFHPTNTLVTRDLATGKETVVRSVEDIFTNIRWHPDGSRLYFAGMISGINTTTIYSYKLGDLRPRIILVCDSATVRELSLTPDGSRLSYVEVKRDESSGFFRVALSHNGKPVEGFSPKGRIWTGLWLDDSRVVTTMGSGVGVLDPNRQSENFSVTFSNGVSRLDVSPDRQMFLAVDRRGEKYSIVVASVKRKAALVKSAPVEGVTDAVFVSNTTIAMGTADGRVVNWNLVTNKQIDSFSAHNRAIEYMTCSPGGKMLLTQTFDNYHRAINAKLWDISGLKN